MPYLKSRTISRGTDQTTYVWACCKCTFTAFNFNNEIAFNTVSVHEVGHQFGIDNSVAFPKTIAEWKEQQRWKKKK